MKIGELAKKTGLTTRTIRYYEELNIIKPKYSKNGTRIFSELDIIKINLINILKQLNFPLSKIQSILSCDKNMEFIRTFIDKEIKNLSSFINELEKIKIENDKAQEMINICKDCDKKPTYENCSNCSKIEKENIDNIVIKSLN
jgi:DNA-binding transcriptional MerR regulator